MHAQTIRPRMMPDAQVISRKKTIAVRRLKVIARIRPVFGDLISLAAVSALFIAAWVAL